MGRGLFWDLLGVVGNMVRGREGCGVRFHYRPNFGGVGWGAIVSEVFGGEH